MKLKEMYQDLAKVKNTELLDKKVVKRETEATLIVESRHDNIKKN